MKVVMVEWVESERGWGIRPDGVSLHHHDNMAKHYIRSYWNDMPDETPDEYSRPNSDPTPVEISDDLYEEMETLRKKGVFGLRLYEHELKNITLS